MSNLSDTCIPQKSLIEVLREKNPFSTTMAPEPWANRDPDITSINRQPFEEICTLIKRKAMSPRVPLAGLVLGEAGEGKTHLLCRILNTCRNLESPVLFAFVSPLIDHKRPLHLLWQKIVACMSKTSEGEEDFSQFDRLVAEIIRDYVRYRITTDPRCDTLNNRSFLEQFEANVFHVYDAEKVRAGLIEEIISDKVSPLSLEIIEKNAVRYVLGKESGTNKPFLDVIFQYKTPEKRGLVRAWLEGDALNEEDCELLGVISRSELSIEAKEQEARDMILTLGILFTRYHLPMVICFDQLDNFDKPELIAGFASMIHLLVNDAASMLPLAFIRADSWNERFHTSPDHAFVHRMESNKFSLSGCTKDEAKELVSRRIEEIFGEKTDDSIAINNWLLPLLDSKLSGYSDNNSPREVMWHVNDMIRNATEDSKKTRSTVSESMAAEYKLAHGAVNIDFETWTPVESEYLKRAAELFLTNQENVLTCVPGEDKYMTWTGTLKASDAGQNGGEIPYACFINTAKNWQRVSAILDRCETFLEKHPNGICTYITDARCDFSPTWKATNEKRQQVEALGGNVVILDQPAAVRWYGLVSLSWKIGSGDILFESEQGLRTATNKDLADFLKTEFSAHAAEAVFDRITKKKAKPNVSAPVPPPQPFPPVNELLRAVRDCLSESTFPVLPMETLMAKLREKDINVTPEWCLEQLGKNQNVVNLLPSRDGYIVKLVISG